MANTLRQTCRNTVRYARNLILDMKYGGYSGGYIPNRYRGATGVSSTDYGLMSQIFGGQIRPDDVLVEVGCGKGRVINWWLEQGLRNRILGLELMDEIADRTRRRLRRHPNVTIIAGDAIRNLPPDGTLLYLANPFDTEEVMTRFLERYRELYAGKDGVRIIYWASVHAHIVRDDPAWEVREVELVLPAAGRFEERHRHLAHLRLRHDQNADRTL